ncbi:hypothetical protein GCM10007857_11700 [Bradyrhizobium iriomotense]|uniref:Uncharacterized protein n=1 Tax=Bradyrhizobium iriomotense TaxID=441950 RepID=A0ABQ6AV14_9BRAD|nr:hypothetical protein GCM10007857_11700 [Bradyrhizobium iriomotense]
MAPNGPVAMPKVRGNEKMPEPTIEPTTIAVSANSESFCIDDVAVMEASRSQQRPGQWALVGAFRPCAFGPVGNIG